MTFEELLEKINDVTPELKSLILEAYQIGYGDGLEAIVHAVANAHVKYMPVDKAGFMMQIVDYEWALYKEKHPKPETMGAIVLTEDELKTTMERRENDMWGMIHADSN